MNLQDEAERMEEMLEALLANQRQRAAERQELALRAVNAAAAVPAYLQNELQNMASERERYTVKSFFKAVYKMLPDRWTTLGAMATLFEYYMAMHDVSRLGGSDAPASNWGWSGVGPIPSWYSPPPPPMAPPEEGPGFFAPAAPEESVVEAAFAKHKRKA